MNWREEGRYLWMEEGGDNKSRRGGGLINEYRTGTQKWD